MTETSVSAEKTAVLECLILPFKTDGDIGFCSEDQLALKKDMLAAGVSAVEESFEAEEAKKHFGRELRLTEFAPDEAESGAREALAIAASALHWLEDSAYEDEAHRELHRYGTYVRQHFPEGCHLEWNGDAYYRTCPVDIAHKRPGFSIGFVGNRLCSICSEDVSECPHRPGRSL